MDNRIQVKNLENPYNLEKSAKEKEGLEENNFALPMIRVPVKALKNSSSFKKENPHYMKTY